jgi:hypothetical protein
MSIRWLDDTLDSLDAIVLKLANTSSYHPKPYWHAALHFNALSMQTLVRIVNPKVGGCSLATFNVKNTWT